MSETVTLPKEDYQAILDRVKSLEEKLDQINTDSEDEDSLKDSASRAIKDSRKFFSGFMNASVVAFNEATHILSDLSEESDKAKLDEVSAGMIGMFRKSIEIQKKVLDRFVEDYEKDD